MKEAQQKLNFLNQKYYVYRWRDVKLRAFNQAKHRTYVDLKVCFSLLLLMFCGLTIICKTTVDASQCNL
jgi:hypothetical protein